MSYKKLSAEDVRNGIMDSNLSEEAEKLRRACLELRAARVIIEFQTKHIRTLKEVLSTKTTERSAK